MPGISPVNTPMTAERRLLGSMARKSRADGSIRSRTLEMRPDTSVFPLVISRMAWGMENSPISATVNSTPPKRLRLPKVNRGVPVVGSMPIMAIKSPIAPDNSPRSAEPCDSEPMMVMPSTAIAKISTGPKFSTS